MKIRHKILLSLLSLVGLLMTMALTAYRSFEQVEHYRGESAQFEAQLLAATNLRAEVRNQLLETHELIFIRGLVKGALTSTAQSVESAFREFERVMNLQLPLEERLQVEMKSLREDYQSLQNLLGEALLLTQHKKHEQAKLALLDARESKFKNGFMKRINDVIRVQREHLQFSSANLREVIARKERALLYFSLIACLTAGLLSFWVSRSIGGRLALLENATLKISQGNFQVSLPEQGSDEVSMLSRAFNRMALSLQEAKDQLTQQQQFLIHSSKMSALGEMAAGVAHEINTPLAIIMIRTEQIEERLRDGKLGSIDFLQGLAMIRKTTDRIAKIVSGLRFFAREGRKSSLQKTQLSDLIEDTLSFCQERFANNGVQLDVVRDFAFETVEVECQSVEISQVLLNLLNNAYDAIEKSEDKWIRVRVADFGDFAEISVTDSGPGISKEVQDKIMQPFFTTKDVGKGTGLGLSISKGIIDAHLGKLYVDTTSAHTRFVILIPKIQGQKQSA